VQENATLLFSDMIDRKTYYIDSNLPYVLEIYGFSSAIETRRNGEGSNGMSMMAEVLVGKRIIVRYLQHVGRNL